MRSVVKSGFALHRYILIVFFFSLLNQQGICQPRKRVLATASMWQDMCKVISGGLVDCDVIVPIGSDPHLYEPTPADLIKVGQSDLILINGLTFEGWLSKLIYNSGTNAKQVIISEGVAVIQSEIYHNATDPHAWMNAANGAVYAKNIANALCILDPLHTEEYQFNAAIYIKQLKDLDLSITQLIQSIPEKHRILITSHDGFRYFGNHYGIQLEPLQGTSTEADVQSTTLLHVNTVIREHQVPAIFVESTINPKLIQQIQKENKIIIGGKLYADSLGDSTSQAGTYAGMLQYDAEVISRALNLADHKGQSSTSIFGNKIYFFIIAFYMVSLAAIYLINKK